MERDFRVESRDYDHMLRGRWQAYRLDAGTQVSDTPDLEIAVDTFRLWLPAGTHMHWATQTRPLRFNCLQFFWPGRWYTLTAFYNGRQLRHTYATIIQPAEVGLIGLSYVDLELSLLVQPDLTYTVLTQAEFDEAARILRYSDEVKTEATQTLTNLVNSTQLSVGVFSQIPHVLRHEDFHMTECHP